MMETMSGTTSETINARSKAVHRISLPTVNYYAGNYVGNYTGNYRRTFQGPSYQSTSSVEYAFNYVGNYTGNYQRAHSKDHPIRPLSTVNYERQVLEEYQGQYIRTFQGPNYQSTSSVAFQGPSYTSTSSAEYIGNYVGDYTGNYQRTFQGVVYTADHNKAYDGPSYQSTSSTAGDGTTYTATLFANYNTDYVATMYAHRWSVLHIYLDCKLHYTDYQSTSTVNYE